MEKNNPDTFGARLKTGGKNLLSTIRDGFKTVIFSPRSFRWFHWLFLAGFIVAVFLAYHFKTPIRNLFYTNGFGVPAVLFDVGNAFGDYPTPVSLGFFLLFYGCASGKKNFTDAGVALLATAAAAGFFTVTGQFIFAEQRPYQGGAMGFFALGGHGVSGHTSASSLMFYPIVNVFFKESKKVIRVCVGVLFIAWPILVGWARMWDDKHFLWNVMLGFAVGFGSGYAVVKARGKTSG